MDFSIIIKNIRTSLKLSQEELARELGVSFATINRWENGKSTPSKLALVAVKEFCNKNGFIYEELKQ
jgi:transcriptional regulator with XRE-family HTH domain